MVDCIWLIFHFSVISDCTRDIKECTYICKALAGQGTGKMPARKDSQRGVCARQAWSAERRSTSA